MSTSPRSPTGAASGAIPPEAAADQLHSLAIHLLRSLRREDEQSGLSGPRLSALSVLVFGGTRTLGELAAAEQVRAPTMSRLVQAMENDGLVKRRHDRSDARVVHFSATPKGARLLTQGRARRVAALTEAIAALDPGDQESLARALDILGRVVASLRDRQ